MRGPSLRRKQDTETSPDQHSLFIVRVALIGAPWLSRFFFEINAEGRIALVMSGTSGSPRSLLDQTMAAPSALVANIMDAFDEVDKVCWPNPIPELGWSIGRSFASSISPRW